MSIESDCPKLGESEGTTVPLLVKFDDEWITLPVSCLEELDWKIGDIIDITPIDICLDDGESPGLVLRNISVEKRNLDN